jgi:hypothetical protein
MTFAGAGWSLVNPSYLARAKRRAPRRPMAMSLCGAAIYSIPLPPEACGAVGTISHHVENISRQTDKE